MSIDIQEVTYFLASVPVYFQSKKSKEIEEEVSDLLSERFGKDAVQVITR
jgi:hypothetical protein